MLKSSAWVVLAGVSLLALAPGCRRNDAAERAQAPADRDPARRRAPKLDLSPGAAEGQNRFQGDALWQLAAARVETGGPTAAKAGAAKAGAVRAGAAEIDWMRLANREGAAGLLEGLDVGRTVGLTALAALPHAPDAELALGRLCELLGGDATAPEDPHLAVLRSLHGIVARPPEPREALATSGYAGCLPVLERLAKAPNLDPERHDLASSALGLLIEHRDAAKR